MKYHDEEPAVALELEVKLHRAQISIKRGLTITVADFSPCPSTKMNISSGQRIRERVELKGKQLGVTPVGL